MAATTSNTYTFGNTQVDDLFRESYERIGISGNDLTPAQNESALMSANLILSAWPGRGLNLWLVKPQMFSLVANQPFYTLPVNTVRVLDVVTTQPARLNVGGTAFSTAGGNPSNCFDPTQTAGCIQTVPNGSIGYDYGAGNSNSVIYVGFTPLVTATYTLTVEYSFDTINWVTVYTAPAQSYSAYQNSWFVVDQSLNARAWRITENGGATLAIQQIYFNQPTQNGTIDRYLYSLSRSDYMAISNKMNTASNTTGYYFEQTITPIMKLWPVPSLPTLTTMTNILYTSYRYAQDVTQLFQLMEVPQRFYEALVSDLAARLALKFAPDRMQILKSYSEEAYRIAASSDFENVTLRINPDFSPYGR